MNNGRTEKEREKNEQIEKKTRREKKKVNKFKNCVRANIYFTQKGAQGFKRNRRKMCTYGALEEKKK